VFEDGLEPSKGLHIFVELDEEGNAINFPGEKGVDWDYFDGKNMSEFLKRIVPYHLASTYVTMNKQKKFDKKQKIHSASPFAIEFNFNFNDDDKETFGIVKKPAKEQKIKNERLIKFKRVEVVRDRLDEYFENTMRIFEIEEENKTIHANFKVFLKEKLDIQISQNPKKFIEIKKFWDRIKETEYCKIYLKNIAIESYENTYAPYLEKNIFNKEKYNLNSKDEIYGAIDYYTTFADGKTFLKHKTGISKDGISHRYTGEEAKLLNLFSELKKSKLFPNPLPLFIDKNEFRNADEMISFFRDDKTLKYSQILKKMYRDQNDRVLQNYYLLYFSGLVIEDFDFVSKFRYSLKENDKYPTIENIFEIKQSKDELKRNYEIKNIFYFEMEIVKTIFNNALVRIDKKKDAFSASYFGEIDPKYVNSESVYQMILKYRKAFYDYIYKSKTQAINCLMWDEIMWNSIIGDLRNTNFDKKYFIEQGIKEKLNIWFSLYNYFTNNLNRINMASKIPELLEKMKKVANNENEHFETTEDFAFGAGQIIYYLLSQSKASERTHALLEPFIQKVKAEQLQNSIAQAVNMYKHEISFGKGRFEQLSSEVLAFETNENLKNYQRLLLAGYFATPVIYEKKENKENNL
jgi:CRISPR-associated protein Csh1